MQEEKIKSWSIPDEDCWFCRLYWRLCCTESAAAILPPLSSSERRMHLVSVSLVMHTENVTHLNRITAS